MARAISLLERRTLPYNRKTSVIFRMGNLVLGMAVLGKSALDRRGYPARRFPFLKWPDSRGTGGRFAVEQVASLPWNRWPISRGIRSRGFDPLTTHQIKQALKMLS